MSRKPLSMNYGGKKNHKCKRCFSYSVKDSFELILAYVMVYVKVFMWYIICENYNKNVVWIFWYIRNRIM